PGESRRPRRRDPARRRRSHAARGPGRRGPAGVHALRYPRVRAPDGSALRRGVVVPLKRLARSAREAWEVPRDLLLGRYPDFVTGGPLARGHVPVFVFHSLEPESFARKL